MKTCPLTVTLPVSLAFLGVILLSIWVTVAPSTQFDPRLPGEDGTPQAVSESDRSELIAGEPIVGVGVPADLAGSWPGFRGPQRDAIYYDGTSLAREWPDGGPPVLWRVEMGEGYAAAAIENGRVYVLDVEVPEPDGPGTADVLRCLSLADGQEIWRNSYPNPITRNHGMSRTIPALYQDAVITLGPRLDVGCWDAETGESRWLFSMVERYGSEERQWYAGQCPLVDEGRVILAPGAPDALLVALDYQTGEEIWRTPNPRGWRMTHSSIMPMEHAGQAMYVYCGTGGTVGVAAEDGRILWDETSWRENFATSPSPLVLPGGRILLSSGYGTIGAMLLQLTEEDGDWRVEAEAHLDRGDFNSEQQTPILYEGHIYGIRKHRGGQLVCLDLDGQEVWNSGADRFGHGPYMIADGLILALETNGELVAAEATSEGYRPVWRFTVFPDGYEAWGPMAMVSGHLVVRDIRQMACLDLRSN